MQVNCDDLVQSHSRWQAEKSGSLHVLLCKDSGGKAAKAAMLKKPDSSTVCFCRLIGNLMFISRGIDPVVVTQDCDYLLVLEACKLDIDYSPLDPAGAASPGYAFRLVFDLESQTVLFRAASEPERSAWVSAIQEASIFDKLEAAEATRQKIIDITGQDPMKPSLLEMPEAAVGAAAAAGGDVDGSGASAAAAGGLELQLSCRRLPPLRSDCSPLQYPNVCVEVHARTPPLQEDWAPVGSTDVVENCGEPVFRKPVIVPDGQYNEESTCLRFDIFDVRDQASRTLRPLYTVESASLQQLESAPELRLLAAGSGRGSSELDSPPTLIVRMHRRTEQLGPSKNRHSVLLRHLCTEQRLVVSSAYNFTREAAPDQQQQQQQQQQQLLTVQEFLCDLKCGMHVPLQVATLELARLRSLESSLQSLGEHNCPPNQPELRPLYRLSQADKSLLTPAVSATCQEFAACVEEANRRLFDGDFVKISRLRASPQLAFVPPNLQLHRLAVVDSREKPLDYLDIVSLGAPVAHHLKFKKGGLLSAFKAAPGLADALDVCEQASTLLHEGSQLCDQLTRLLISARQRAAQHQQLSSAPAASTSPPAMEPPRLPAAVDAERLTDLVNKLIFLASNFLIVQARIALELDSVGMQQLHRLLVDVTSAATTSSSTSSSSSNDLQRLAGACDALLREVSSVWLQCRLTLARLWLSEAGKVPSDALLTAHKRRVTSFSQLLTAVACGVAAHFARWGEAAWRQMEACGIPVYLESLLSAYRSECGMLEDMVATVPRLADVTVAFFPGAVGDQPIVEDSLRRVRICVPQQLWDRLSGSLDSLLRGHSFRLVPVLLSVGINEQQTLAERKRMASLGVQRDLNRRSAATLKKLVDQVILYRRSNPSTGGPGGSSAAAASQQFDGTAEDTGRRSVEQRLRDLLQLAELHVLEDRSKPVGLLHTVEEIFWLLDGVRLTNCKSGKDRTAMSVTLEQARWLREHHRLRAASFDSTVAFLRTYGLRRRNCFRNIGSSYYAFHRLQLHTFPAMYRPPKGTYERGPT